MWQETFYALLFSGSADERAEAYELRRRHLPHAIFKYRAPSELSLDGVRKNSVWLSAASNFNDPYDSSVGVDCLPALRDLLRANFRLDPPSGLDHEELEAIVRSDDPLGALMTALRGVGTDLTEQAAEQLNAQLLKAARAASVELSSSLSTLNQNALKICSFSTDPKSALMWAHYAESHRGFCVEYPVDSLPDDDVRCQSLFPVRYGGQQIDLGVEFQHFARSGPSVEMFQVPLMAAIHKSNQWAYEREWRMIRTVDDDSAGFEVSMPTPTAIYFGVRMEAAFRARLCEIAASAGIPVYEMCLTSGDFSLEPVARGPHEG